MNLHLSAICRVEFFNHKLRENPGAVSMVVLFVV